MENCMKLEVLLHRATYIFRELFLIRWRLTHEGREWINCEKTGQEFIAGFGKHVYDQASPQVKECLRSGDVTQWDITTLARVLRQSEYPFADIGNPWFDRRVRRENDKIRRLILVRNRVVHHPTKNISDTDFNTWWNEVSELLVSLGDSKIVLNRWKQFSLEDLLKPTNAIENIVLDKGHNIKPKPARPKTGANKGTTNNPTSTTVFTNGNVKPKKPANVNGKRSPVGQQKSPTETSKKRRPKLNESSVLTTTVDHTLPDSPLNADLHDANLRPKGTSVDDDIQAFQSILHPDPSDDSIAVSSVSGLGLEGNAIAVSLSPVPQHSEPVFSSSLDPERFESSASHSTTSITAPNLETFKIVDDSIPQTRPSTSQLSAVPKVSQPVRLVATPSLPSEQSDTIVPKLDGLAGPFSSERELFRTSVSQSADFEPNYASLSEQMVDTKVRQSAQFVASPNLRTGLTTNTTTLRPTAITTPSGLGPDFIVDSVSQSLVVTSPDLDPRRSSFTISQYPSHGLPSEVGLDRTVTSVSQFTGLSATPSLELGDITDTSIRQSGLSVTNPCLELEWFTTTTTDSLSGNVEHPLGHDLTVLTARQSERLEYTPLSIEPRHGIDITIPQVTELGSTPSLGPKTVSSTTISKRFGGVVSTNLELEQVVNSTDFVSVDLERSFSLHPDLYDNDVLQSPEVTSNLEAGQMTDTAVIQIDEPEATNSFLSEPASSVTKKFKCCCNIL